MKIKNIVFSGFAAAILMGTVGANATTTPAKIASQAYVDTEIAKLSGENGSVTELASDVADLQTTVGNTALTTTAQTLTGAVNELNTAVSGKAAASDVTALQTTMGNTALSTTAQTVTGAINELDSALDTKVNLGDAATTIRTVSGGASDSKWATEKAVATIVEGITGGTGAVSQQIADALGDLGSGNTTVEDALADKQDNLSEAQLNAANSGVTAAKVSSYDTHIANNDIHVTAEQKTAWTAKQNALSEAQLNAVNSGATSALIAKISTNESAITALQTLTDVLDGYNTCITQQNGSGHCVLTASSGGLSWVNVSRPFEVE